MAASGSDEMAAGDVLAAILDTFELDALAPASDWCPACGEPLDGFGRCPRAGTPGHLDEHGHLLR